MSPGARVHEHPRFTCRYVIRHPRRPTVTETSMQDLPDYPRPGLPGFSAASLDRMGHWRNSDEERRRHLDDAGLVLVHRYRMPVNAGQIQLLPATELGDALAEAIWLGMWKERSIYALDVSAEAPERWPQLRFADLRGAAMRLDPDHAAVMAYARAMVYWQRQHRHCGRCGGPTEAAQAGHVRRCPRCEVEHYPRTDPSMLALVTDGGNRCLLGRQPSWAPGFWSTLAGFVEPGETVEDAVIREVWEEARIQVTGMRYVASQSWPFPASVLFGFHARARPDQPQVEQDELEAADWFDRERIADELRAAGLSRG